MWGVPGLVLVAIAVAGVLLVLAASWVPSSRAVAVAPVEALRAAGYPVDRQGAPPTLVLHGKGGGPKNEFFEDA